MPPAHRRRGVDGRCHFVGPPAKPVTVRRTGSVLAFIERKTEHADQEWTLYGP